jgi:hypothetical protein
MVGGPYRFSGLSGGQYLAVQKRFAPLCSVLSPRNADLPETWVQRADARDFRPLTLPCEDYVFDRDCTEGGIRLADYSFMGRIHWGPALAGKLWIPTQEPGEFLEPLENFFRVWVGYRMLQCGGVLLHSAAISRDGGGYLFVGHSGAGKTTLSRLALAAGWEVLSDDMNAVVLDQQGYRVAQLPFAGDLGQTAVFGGVCRLRGIYTLEQGEDHRIDTLSPASAIARLLGSSPVVNQDPFRCDLLLSILSHLQSRVPVRQLTFSRDPGFLRVLEMEGP